MPGVIDKRVSRGLRRMEGMSRIGRKATLITATFNEFRLSLVRMEITYKCCDFPKTKKTR